MTQSSNCTKLETGHWKEIAATLANCNNLLWATIDKEEGKVAEYTELAHETYSSALKYNDENALSCVVTMAYTTKFILITSQTPCFVARILYFNTKRMQNSILFIVFANFLI